jgi:hypothetical protein
MDPYERKALGLDTFANEKLLPLPVIHATAQQPGDTVLVSVKATFGAAFAGTKLKSIVPLKLKPNGTTVPLRWQPVPADISAGSDYGQYAWTDKDGRAIDPDTVMIQGHEIYFSTAIKDNGDLDWDRTAGSVIDPITLASGSSSAATTNTGNGYAPGGGCDTGLGLAAAGMLLAAASAARRRGKRG